MFKVGNTIVTRKFLQEAYNCEGIGECYREIIKNIVKENPFASFYEISKCTILNAYADEDVPKEWKEKIKDHFKIEKDDEFYNFGKSVTIDTKFDKDVPFMIANDLLKPYSQYRYKCLILKYNYDVVVEKVNDRTILKFKKKW
jgi:hypothetical protein